MSCEYMQIFVKGENTDFQKYRERDILKNVNVSDALSTYFAFEIQV